MNAETGYSVQFPIPRVYPPGYARARPLFALSAAGGRRREVPRITNVAYPRRPFFLCFARDLVSLPAPVACESLNSISSAHDRLPVREHRTTPEYGREQNGFAVGANG